MAGMWVKAQHLLPQRLVCRVVYHAARARAGWIKAPLIRWFARQYRIDLAQAAEPDLSRYATFNDFFTRALSPGARPLEGEEHTIIAPVDGVLTELGPLDGARVLQAKGIGYSLAELLDDTDAAARLAGGGAATLYLAPHHYHRVHAPIAATLRHTWYVPGHRYSVNAATVRGIPGLFCRNERVVCWFDTAAGPMAVVLVGALNVSSIATPWLGEIASGRRRRWDEPAEARAVGRGEEIGRFNLGSTVIVLFPPGAMSWRTDLELGAEVRMGQALGALIEAAGT